MWSRRELATTKTFLLLLILCGHGVPFAAIARVNELEWDDEHETAYDGASDEGLDGSDDELPTCASADVDGRYVNGKWKPFSCRLIEYTQEQVRACLSGKTVNFIGNSVMYHIALTFRRFLDDEAQTSFFQYPFACWNYGFDYTLQYGPPANHDPRDHSALHRCTVLRKENREKLEAKYNDYAAKHPNDNTHDHNGQPLSSMYIPMPVSKEVNELLQDPDIDGEEEQGIRVTFTKLNYTPDLVKVDANYNDFPEAPLLKELYNEITDPVSDLIVLNCGVWDILHSKQHPEMNGATDYTEKTSKGRIFLQGESYARNAPYVYQGCSITHSLLEKFATSPYRVVWLTTNPWKPGLRNKTNQMQLHFEAQTMIECQRASAKQFYMDVVPLYDVAVDQLQTYLDQIHFDGIITDTVVQLILNSLCNDVIT